MALALVLGIIAVVAISRRSPDPAAAVRPSQPGRTAAPASTGRCSLPDADQNVPTSPPPEVNWQIWDTVALPYSPAAGPQIITGDIARCYAHTPTGSLIAAAQISLRYVLASRWQQVLTQQVVPGPGTRVYAAQRAQDPAVNTTQPGQYGQYAGFKFVTYLPAVAVMDIAARLPDGTLQMITMTVQWSGDDWRLALDADGSPGGTPDQIPGLTGFVPWGGV